MTNEEAKVFLDNLKICIDEHPIVADWLVEIADRKTEPSSSEIPNSSTISKMEQVDKDINVRSKDEPQRDIHCSNCKYHDKYGCEPPCDTCEGMSNHKPKDEPQLTPNYCGTCKHREVPCGDLPCDVCHGYSNYEPKDEPQKDCNGCKFVGTYDTEFPCANCSRKTKDYYANDEPQTEDEILREQCRAFMGIVEQTERSE